MGKIKYFIFCVISSLNAVIIQTNCMEEILPHVDETSWVLFDLDNVLIESALHAGRAEWFDHEVAKLMAAQGIDRHTADRLLIAGWNAFMEICPIQTPETNMSELVKTIQKKSEASLALTARPPHLSKLTLRQLKLLEIDFSFHAPEKVLLKTIHPTHWEEGALFASLNSKGGVFRQFIEKLDQKPKKVLFIDDALHHLEGMERECLEAGVEFIGFHYTKSTERFFDPDLASREYHELLQDQRN
jgi:FMN phosphatase YigB (HAD superfamily)